MLDLKSRLTGMALLLASAGGALIHRSVYEATRNGAAQPAEFALGLLTLLLASTGILMLIHGDKLFARKLDRLEPRSPTSKTDTLDMVGPPLPADSVSTGGGTRP